MKINDITYNFVKESVLKQGYEFATDNLKLNIVAYRTKNRYIDNWDDYLTLTWIEHDKEQIKVFGEFTTDPGIYYMVSKLLNPLGCGILKKGQWKNMLTEGIHNSSYKALIQINPVTVYRDRNRDNFMDIDESNEYTGMYGVNLHHGYSSTNVNNNSALCQVLRKKSDLDILMAQYTKHKSIYGSKIDYTLIHEEDV